ncbi:RidA family protein [Jiulongibacter sp. NS-SX5]|uniref:RidA family protein n=1 Tax=Jiulongibacter sp. NS-SX5 TaxID=3463854 RepID=UPI004058D5C1
MRQNLFSGTRWEEEVGYSRAVKIGNIVEVSGTVSVTNSGEIVGEGDPYLQARFIFMRIQNALESLNAEVTDVIRTRVYLRNLDDWEKVGKAHKEFFGEVKPANTFIAVPTMINDAYLVEVEATAVLPR